VPRLDIAQLEQKRSGESSEAIRERVVKAREIQRQRYKRTKIMANSGLRARHFEKYCPMTKEARQLLHRAFGQLNFSMRAHDRIIKVARTIADLAGVDIIEAPHIAEAIQYRSLDRQT